MSCCQIHLDSALGNGIFFRLLSALGVVELVHQQPHSDSRGQPALSSGGSGLSRCDHLPHQQEYVLQGLGCDDRVSISVLWLSCYGFILKTVYLWIVAFLKYTYTYPLQIKLKF